MSSQPTYNQATHITTAVGSTGLAIPSTQAGQNVNESYLQLKSFPPITLSNTIPTALPNVTSGIVYVTNPLGNAYIAVGGLPGTNDAPSFAPGTSNAATGTRVSPNGQPVAFRMTNGSSLTAIAQRNGDIIEVQADLAGANFTTPTSTLTPNPLSLVPFAVVSTTPATGATNVATNQVIEVVFNRAVGATSVKIADFSVVPQVPTITTYLDPTNSSQLDIDPKGFNLAPGTLYTVTINADDVEDTFGNSLTTPYSFTFTIGQAPPAPPALTVSSVSPGNGTTGIAANTVVTVVMSTTVVSSGVTPSNVQLIQVGGSAVTTTVNLGPDRQTITITPSSNLAFATEYKVVVQNLVSTQNINQSPTPWDGVSEGPNSGAFTTSGALTVNTVTPGTNATGVAISSNVVIVMSEQVESANVTTSNVKLIQVSNSSVVTQAGGSPSLGGDLQTITLTPSANLSPNTQYKVLVQNQVNLSSVTQTPNPWDGASQGPGLGEFTTVGPPTVSSVIPGSASTDVAVNTAVTVVMSQTVQSAGVTTSNVKLETSGGAVVTQGAGSPSLGSDNKTITITPSANLAYNTEYKVVIQNLVGTNGVTQSPTPWDGISQGPNAGAFTTIVQPTVVSVTPGNNATGVAITTDIVVVMSEQIVSGGVTTSNVKLFNASNNTLIPSSVSIAPDNETITINPTSSLAYSTQYYVVVQNLQSLVGDVTQSPNPYDPFSSGGTQTESYNVAQSACGTVDNLMFSPYITSSSPNYGETASAGNGLTSGPVVKVVLPQVAGSNNAFNTGFSQNAPTGTIGVQIVDSSSNVKYTFGGTNGTFTASSTGYGSLCTISNPNFTFKGWTNITLEDTNNTYTMQAGDSILITWSGTGNNYIAVSNSIANTYGLATQQVDRTGQDLAAQIWTLVGGGTGPNAFTTTAQTFTQIYNVSGNSSPCSSSGSGWGPLVGGTNFCSAGGSGGALGSGSGFGGSGGANNLTTFGEIASSTNGLVGKVINKVVLPTVIGSNNEFGSTSSTPPTGNIGIKIIKANGTTAYTFSSTFASTSTGFNQICTVSCGGGSGSVYGWSNITLTDTANTYVMTAGDMVAVTWSGTGQNIIMVLQNTGSVYGKGGYTSGSSGSPTSISSVDMAATMYQAS